MLIILTGYSGARRSYTDAGKEGTFLKKISKKYLERGLQYEKPVIIAHRGASAYAPENTMAAFKKALEMKAGG